jgi:predicted DNA-binding transcriptional regulator AlpA
MPDPQPLRYMRTPDAAKFLGLSARTLEKHRSFGTGPRYRKLGGRVVYFLDDLKAWVDRAIRTSTRDRGRSVVLPARRRSRIPYAGKERH